MAAVNGHLEAPVVVQVLDLVRIALQGELGGQTLAQGFDAVSQSRQLLQLARLDLGKDLPYLVVHVEGDIKAVSLLDLHTPQAIDGQVRPAEVVGRLLTG